MTYVTSATDFIHAPQFGEGAPVVLLHGSASSSSQWRSMIAYLEGRFKIIAPDLPGYGKSGFINDDQILSLEDIARRFKPVIEREARPVHIVGHSFGGAVALKFASMFPGMVQSLTLIEPAAFNLIYQEFGQLSINHAVQASRAAMEAGDAATGMRAFVDFWNGEGAWERTSENLRDRLTTYLKQIHSDFDALVSDRFTDLDAAGVVCPALLLKGENSPNDMTKIVDALRAKIPFLQTEIIPGSGHMVPLTDPHLVDPMVANFIAKTESSWQGSALAA